MNTTVVDEIRGVDRRRWEGDPGFEPQGSTSGLLEGAIRSERDEALGGALLSLDATDRELLLGYYMDGRKLRDLAPLHGLSQAAASKRVQRALRELGERYPELALEDLERPS